MIGWHQLLNGDEFEQAPGDAEGQGNLACCSPWGHKGLAMGEQLNNSRYMRGFPHCISGKEPTYQCRRHKRCGLDLCAGKIPWRREWQPGYSSILAWRIPGTVEPGGL